MRLAASHLENTSSTQCVNALASKSVFAAYEAAGPIIILSFILINTLVAILNTNNEVIEYENLSIRRARNKRFKLLLYSGLDLDRRNVDELPWPCGDRSVLEGATKTDGQFFGLKKAVTFRSPTAYQRQCAHGFRLINTHTANRK